jgi:hypothetical protein
MSDIDPPLKDRGLMTRVAILEAQVRLMSLAMKAFVALVIGLAVTYMFNR